MRVLGLLTLLVLTAAACGGESKAPSVPAGDSQPDELAAPSAPRPAPVPEPGPVPPPEPLPPEEEPPVETPTPTPPAEMPTEPLGPEDSPQTPDPAREPAPEISGTTLEGKAVALSDLLGKPVFVNVWASW